MKFPDLQNYCEKSYIHLYNLQTVARIYIRDLCKYFNSNE